MRLAGGRFHLPIRHGDARRREGTRGQSFTELALVLPVWILVVLIGLDLGRALLGWVSLQQASRIAANYASLNPEAWNTPPDNTKQNKYRDLIESDTAGINCTLPNRNQLPDPDFPSGTAVGMPAKVTLSCDFDLATPIIAAFLPNPLSLSGSASFPIRHGPLPGTAGAGQGPVPQSAFSWSPSTGTSGQAIQFIDGTPTTPPEARPTGWSWSFGDGATDTVQNPSHAFTCASGTCQFSVTLRASNVNGAGTLVTHTISVQALVLSPVACFSPTSGTYGAPVSVTFSDCSTNGPYSWSWNFGDGTSAVTGTTPPATTSHTFQCSTGQCHYTVALTVTNGVDTPSTYTSQPFTFNTTYCAVPAFVNLDVKTAANLTTISNMWTGAGFTAGNLAYNPSNGLPAGSGNHKVRSQTLTANSIQPCTAGITLNWS